MLESAPFAIYRYTNTMKNIRNIAIIAHVDHGKTTLVDQLLRQSGTFRANQQVDERVMDSNDLEKERGITILAKNTAIEYEGYHINIVDTPGHADFGGEVERVLGMVDCVVLLVDAQEGPMPQTRFVTKKALALGLKPIVVINKIDKPTARASWVIDQTFDLFDNLGATEEQLDFPIVYASGLSGFAKLDENDDSSDMRPLFDTILKHTPAPSGDADAPLQLQISQLDYDNYTGRLGIGRILNGRIKPGQVVAVMNHEQQVAQGRINQLLGFKGLERVPQEEAEAGDIVIISGIEDIGIGVTIADRDNPVGLPMLSVDEPTLTMDFMVNTSPLAGTEGKFVTSRQIRDRLQKELLTNVALRVEDTADADVFRVSGRGELHLTILLENMRREGYELAVGKPRVVFREIDGQKCEPYENLTVDVPDDNQGAVMEELGRRRGELTNMESDGNGRTRLEYRPRPDRLPRRIHDHDARRRPDEPRLRRLRSRQTRHARSPQRRTRLPRARRSRRLRPVEPGRPRSHVRLPRRQTLRRHDHRHPQPRQRLGRQPAQRQKAHQRARQRHRRSRAPDHAD